MLRNNNILIVSNEPWGDVWFSKHHYAWELAKENRVFFLEAPGNWKLSHLWSNRIERKEITSSLAVVRYNNYLPLTGSIPLLNRINNKMICALLSNYFREENFFPFIFLSFDPVRLTVPQMLKPSVSLFYSVDNHSHETEYALAANADIVLAVSDHIANKYSTINKQVHYIPHGIPANELSPSAITGHAVKKQVLYMGSINYRLNYALLDRLSEKLADHTFILAGSIDKKEFTPADTETFTRLEARKNVQFIGPVHFNGLKDHILNSALCLCFYKTDYISNKLNSLKILQYLSFGKTVISNHFEMYRDAFPGLIYQTDDETEFEHLVMEKIANPDQPALALERINYTKQFEYPRLIEQIEEHINRVVRL